VKAQYNLGALHEVGRGLAQSYEKAAMWWQKAAEQGDADAQFNLGLLFEDGHGVVQSKKKATMWWQKAAEQGHEQALQKLSRKKLLSSPVSAFIDKKWI
jgi:TPR repeat protein